MNTMHLQAPWIAILSGANNVVHLQAQFTVYQFILLLCLESFVPNQSKIIQRLCSLNILEMRAIETLGRQLGDGTPDWNNQLDEVWVKTVHWQAQLY